MNEFESSLNTLNYLHTDDLKGKAGRERNLFDVMNCKGIEVGNQSTIGVTNVGFNTNVVFLVRYQVVF